MLEIEALDFNLDGVESSFSSVEGIGGLLLKLGFRDVPVTLWLTLLVFLGWMFCYFLELLALRFLPLGWLRYPLGLVALCVCLMLALPVVRLLSTPLRPLFRKVNRDTTRSLIGQVVVVRSGKVTLQTGQASLEDGGAGLILRIRAEEELGLKRGDRVVLLDYLPAEHAYRVITENEFNDV